MGSSAFPRGKVSSSVVKVVEGGNVTSVANVTGCSFVAFGKGEADEKTLYISTNSGVVLSSVVV